MKSSNVSRRASMLSSIESHLTILRPRESLPSDIISVFGTIMNMDDRNIWRIRMKFICRTVSYCLGPGNIWRFPRQAFMFGNASFIYIYMVYIWLFGTSLLVFEISLGQYFTKGFARMFTICPFMEGITISMVFYCLISNMLYSMVNIYSFIYMFSALVKIMPHAHCSFHVKYYDCKENYTTYTVSPGYAYFHDYVVAGFDIHGDKGYNWRNGGLLILFWAIVCFMIIFSTMRYYLISVILSVFIIITLVFTAIATSVMKGATMGLQQMFIPTSKDITRLSTWIYPFEQTVISLGIGVGPLTTFWSLSSVKYWSHIDCVIVNAIVFICSLLSGMILFNAAGVISFNSNNSISDIFKEENISHQTQNHILLSDLFNRVGYGISNFTLFAFYLMLFCTCCQTSLECVQVVLLFVTSYVSVKNYRRITIIACTCFVFYAFATVVPSKIGYPLMMSVDKIFIAPALIIIIFCESVAVIYFYGMQNLCDDIEFLLGFVPSYYYQATWLLLPALSLIYAVISFYLKYTLIENKFDKLSLGLIIVCIIMPIVLVAVYKLYLAIKAKDIRKLTGDRGDIIMDDL